MKILVQTSLELILPWRTSEVKIGISLRQDAKQMPHLPYHYYSSRSAAMFKMVKH